MRASERSDGKKSHVIRYTFHMRRSQFCDHWKGIILEMDKRYTVNWRYRVSTPKKTIILWFSMIKVLFWFFKMMLKIDNPLVLVVYWTGGGVKRNQIWYIFFQSPLPLGYTHPNPAPTPLRRKGKNIGIFQGSLSAPRFFLLYFTETFWNQNFRVPYFSAVMPPHALNNEPSRKCVQTNQTNVE